MKWLLVIPHYIVLAFFWIAFSVLTIIAFFAILFTGRYPRSLFDFNVGVLRWSWRVGYYSFSALGTDRYPPFTLADVPDYPAALDVDYPQQLSRGLVLVKWWLLAIPHYLIIGIFLGSGYAFTRDDNWAPPGLIGLLVIFAGIALLFTGRYPRGLFDFVLGMNRWVLRVAAYAGLMTDAYPPFRLDGGADEPAEPGPVPPTAPETASAAGPAAPRPAVAAGSNWTAGRVVSVVVGALLLVTGLAAAAGGGVTAWADQVMRDEAGYVSAPTERLTSSGYALRYDAMRIGSQDWNGNELDWLGMVRVRATGSPEDPLFIGIAPTSDVDRYLGRPAVDRDRVRNQNDQTLRWQHVRQPVTAPVGQPYWVAASDGIGEQALTWDATAGDWTLVVMNADGSAGVDADVRVAATLPVLRGVWIGLLVAGGLGMLAGALLITLGVHGARAPRTRGAI